jgi:hypothetical protein
MSVFIGENIAAGKAFHRDNHGIYNNIIVFIYLFNFVIKGLFFFVLLLFLHIPIHTLFGSRKLRGTESF